MLFLRTIIDNITYCTNKNEFRNVSDNIKIDFKMIVTQYALITSVARVNRIFMGDSFYFFLFPISSNIKK